MNMKLNNQKLIIAISMAAGVALTLTLQALPGEFGSAQAATASNAQAATASNLMPPTAWRMDELKEMELEAHPDWPSASLQSGTARNSGARLHEGQNNVTLWNAGPAVISVLPGFPYDQFVLVLKGQLVLTDTNANSATYNEGDMFMIPRGWAGTWDMTEEYREFIIVPGE